MQFRSIVFNLTVVSALVLASSTALAQINFPLESPTLQVGDSWSYKVTDQWKKEVSPNLWVKTVATIDNFIRYTGTSVTGAEFRYGTNKAHNITYMVDKELQMNKLFVWPLTEASIWENKRKEKSGAVTIFYDSECKVKGAEKVTVPAGTFDAVKIVCKGNYNNDNLRPDGSVGGNGNFVEEKWYAPSVKQTIKTATEFWHGGRLSAQMLTELATFKVQ